MQITYFDDKKVSAGSIKSTLRQLGSYREEVQKVVEKCDQSKPEYSLALWQDTKMLAEVEAVTKKFKKVEHVVLIGIGGSSLGTEAIHSVLATPASPHLHVLDTVSTHELQTLLRHLSKVKKAEQIAICVISKSGGTTETLANAEEVLAALAQQFTAKQVYRQTIFIGDKSNQLLKKGSKLGINTIAMPAVVGGRYSVFTPVGLVPLKLLGHDLDTLLTGLKDATTSDYELLAAEGAAHLYGHLKRGSRNVNFFAFDTRFVRLGKWYRQLTAESLGKAVTKKKRPVKLGFIPTISTAVELHSIGQLYLSGFQGVYTDFVGFDPEQLDEDLTISKKPIVAAKLKSLSLNTINDAIFGGVKAAYMDRKLAFRSTIFDVDPEYELGLFMGMRMLETMYMANLLNVNAFDQPNVELYKDKTREILDSK